MHSLDQFPKILAEMLLKHDFQLPIVFTMVGIDGHIFAGRFEFSDSPDKAKFAIVTGEASKLRFPINSLLVDRNGKAAHVFFENPSQPARSTSFQNGILEEAEKRFTECLDLFRQMREGSIGPEEFIAKAEKITKAFNKEAEKMQLHIEKEHKTLLN